MRVRLTPCSTYFHTAKQVADEDLIKFGWEEDVW